MAGAPPVSENEFVDIRLLGGVDVVVRGERVALGGVKPRALLAVLALQPGTVVGVDRLVDDVWGDLAPPSVRASVQVHVSNLRRALAGAGAAGLVETRGRGYAFTGDPAAVDVHRFGARLREARACFNRHDLDGAAVRAREARTLWRGLPLAGLGDAPFVVGHAAALEADFLALIDLYADVEIALGRPAEVVGDLEHVVVAHPYRESTWARLALALYRSGRQVDALDRLRTVRRVLADELGLDVSPDVGALEVAMLSHDPALLGATDSPAGRTGPTPGTSRLPRSRQLIGRDDLVRSVEVLLDDERLVTIVGPGGVGKTSVAIAAAAAISAAGDASARFVDLSTVSGPGSLLPAFLAGLGAPADGAVDTDSVAAALRTHASPLLVVDNCEHVLDEVADLLEDLLGRVPRTRVLATSRTPLSSPSEVVVACEPLEAQHAIELFVTRAQSADRTYDATGTERAAIATLVELLDGLPLGIELFSARIRSLSAVDMVARLDDERLDTTWRAGASRHRSLRDAVAWSHDLLHDDARVCLRRLSVFGGSVGADAARAVCDVADAATLDLLVASSLVVADRTATGMRYRLLATVRAFASDELDRHAERALVSERLVAWFTGWAESIAVALDGPDPAPAVEQLDAEAPNIRVARDIARQQPGGSARLLAAFGPIALGFSLALPDAAAWAREAADDPAAGEHDRMVLSILVARLTNVGTADRVERLQSAIAAADRLGDVSASAAAWAELALAVADVAEDGLAAAERAIELAVAAGRPVTLGWALNIALTELLRLRRFDDAGDLFARHCTTGTRRFGVHEGHVLFQWGRAAMLTGDLVAAGERFATAEAAAIRARSMSGQSTAWFGLAEVDRRSGRIAEAHDRYCRCLPVDLVMEPGESGLVRMFIAWTACLLGRLAVAEHHASVLVAEAELERAGCDTADVTMQEACAAGAEALIAVTKGWRSHAHRSLGRAVESWSVSGSWDVVSDLLSLMSELYVVEAPEREQLAALARQVWDGSVPLADAVAAALAASPPG